MKTMTEEKLKRAHEIKMNIDHVRENINFYTTAANTLLRDLGEDSELRISMNIVNKKSGLLVNHNEMFLQVDHEHFLADDIEAGIRAELASLKEELEDLKVEFEKL